MRKQKTRFKQMLTLGSCRAYKAAILVMGAVFSVSIQAAAPNSVALSGYDPVNYFTQHQALKGSVQFQQVYQGQIYYFANQQDKARFNEDPAHYLPAYEGFSAMDLSMGLKLPADPTVFTLYQNKLYLNANVQQQQRWVNNIKQLVHQTNQFVKQTDLDKLPAPNALQIKITRKLDRIDSGNWLLSAPLFLNQSTKGSVIQYMWFNRGKVDPLHPTSKVSKKTIMGRETFKWAAYPLSSIQKMSPNKVSLQSAVMASKLHIANECKDLQWSSYEMTPEKAHYSYQFKCHIMGMNINGFAIQKMIQNNEQRKTIAFYSTLPVSPVQKKAYSEMINHFKF